MSRSNIVKMLTQEQKQELYQMYLKREHKTKKALAKEVGISTRTLGRVIDEMSSNNPVNALRSFGEAAMKGAVIDVYDYSITKSQITIFKNDESRSVVKGYPKFNTIKKNLVESCFSDKVLKASYNLLSLPNFVEKFSEGNITVDHKEDKVWYGTFEIKNSIVTRMMQMLSNQENVKPLVLFLEKLLMNPKKSVVDELYAFLQHNDIEISNDGDIIAYRSVRNDFMDFHTGTMDNSVGNVVQMPRTLVDDNPNVTCSSGLHVASIGYAKGFGSNNRLVKVKVCPSDVVSVPVDYDSMKMRCCKFEVLEEVSEGK